jgi:succinate dehydrogenase/fumarate reductase flavoprotein subunit
MLWDVSVDVLVMGSGGAGHCAALRAHDLALGMLVVQQQARRGGSTLRALSSRVQFRVVLS